MDIYLPLSILIMTGTQEILCIKSADSKHDVRLSYVGCDIVKLANSNNNLISSRAQRSLLLSHPILTRPDVAQQILVNIDNQVFYVDKIIGIVEPVINKSEKLRAILASLSENNSQLSLSLEQIEIIAEKTKLPNLYLNAARVKDIEIKLTQEQRRQALCKLTDDNINFKNSAYTYIFQGFIAKYMGESEHELRALEDENNSHQPKPVNDDSSAESTKKFASAVEFRKKSIDKIKAMRAWATDLHKLSTHFIPLESFVNNSFGDPLTRLNDFQEKLTAFHHNILQDLDNLINNESGRRKLIIERMRKNIDDNCINFFKQIESIRNNSNKRDLDCLLSVADRDLYIKSLGSFMREQMSYILDAGIKVTYKISGNRLQDIIQVPRLVAFLSDAKHLMLIKGQSIVEGPKENDTYSPMPAEMLASLTGVEELDKSQQYYFSLTPYFKNTHPKYLDEILCLLTNKSRDDNNLHGNYFYHFCLQPLKLLASAVEIAFAVPRLLLIISLGIVEACLSILPFKAKANSEKITWRINEFITNIYAYFSPIFAPYTYLQNTKASRYKRKNADGDDHQRILDACADYSSYCFKLFKYFTPQLVATSIQEFFLSIFTSITNFFADLKYLLAPTSNNQEVYEKVKIRHQSLELLNKVFAKQGIKPTIDESLPITGDHYVKVKYCDTNDIQSPLDVFYEIMVVLANDVVNPMFRKSPGVATFYFALSMLTFGTLVLPTSVFTWMQPLPAGLQYLVNKISINFTGKPTSAGLMEKLVACFLGWKLGFFSTEFIVEMFEGHYEILEKIFEEPEKIVLGLVGLVGLGMGLQYIPELPTNIKIPGLPELPNPYLVIINTFTEEAKSCADGMFGLNSIEYGFLGLKFAMLMHSMLSNSEKQHEKLTQLEKIALTLLEQNFFQELLDYCKKQNIIGKGSNPETVQILEEFLKPKLQQHPQVFSSIEINKFARLLTEKIQESNNFLQTEDFSKAKEIINQQKQPPKLKPGEIPQDLESIRKELNIAIDIIINDKSDGKQNILLAPSIFGINKEGHQMYDHLDAMFDAYNAALLKEKPNDFNKYWKDKSLFLDLFFNKYVYKRSNNFVRSFLILVYPLPVISRGLKYLWATLNNKPSMQHQVIKNFSKDFVILSEIFSPLARILADFNLYLSGVLRCLAYCVIVPIAGIIYPLTELGKYLFTKGEYQRTPFKAWLEVIDEYICKYIALHKTPELKPLRQLIVRASRVAGVNTNLKDVGKKIIAELNLEASNTESPKQNEIPDSYTKINLAGISPSSPQSDMKKNLNSKSTSLKNDKINKSSYNDPDYTSSGSSCLFMK